MASRCGSTLAGMLAIVGVATMVGAAHSMMKPVKLKRTAAPSQTDGGATPVGVVTGGPESTPEQNPQATLGDGEIGLARAQQLYDEYAVFLDARPLYQYEQGHITGSHWMPVERVMDNGALFFEIEDLAGGQDQTVVIYCGGGDCDASHNLAIVLEQAGFTNLLIFVDGYPAWEAAGLDTQVGAPPEIEP